MGNWRKPKNLLQNVLGEGRIPNFGDKVLKSNREDCTTRGRAAGNDAQSHASSPLEPVRHHCKSRTEYHPGCNLSVVINIQGDYEHQKFPSLLLQCLDKGQSASTLCILQ